MTERGRSITAWAVGLVMLTVATLAGWGLKADRAAVAAGILEAKAAAKAADAKAERAVQAVALGRVDVEVLKSEVGHVRQDLTELKGMVRELLVMERRGTRNAGGS